MEVRQFQWQRGGRQGGGCKRGQGVGAAGVRDCKRRANYWWQMRAQPPGTQRGESLAKARGGGRPAEVPVNPVLPASAVGGRPGGWAAGIAPRPPPQPHVGAAAARGRAWVRREPLEWLCHVASDISHAPKLLRDRLMSAVSFDFSLLFDLLAHSPACPYQQAAPPRGLRCSRGGPLLHQALPALTPSPLPCVEQRAQRRR